MFKHSGKKYTFNCEQCSCEFTSILSDISKGHWCPICKNKTERIILDFCRTLYNNVDRQFSPSWCINPDTKGQLRFDILIPQYKLIIECDGPQHFYDQYFWNSLASDVRDRDLYKMKLAIENGYYILRLNQNDVIKNNIDWKNIIQEFIIKLDGSLCNPIFFGSKDIKMYDNHDVLFINV
ncbi:MAG: hypothetical protein PHG66_04455 [Candidatus Colwellbacteria bacterium]|nr:hypothetical protein [Candidatus Colwellbacteria bacterium]